MESQLKQFSLRREVNHVENASHDNFNGNGDNNKKDVAMCLDWVVDLTQMKISSGKKQTNNGVMRVLLWRNDLAAIITALD